MLPNASSLWSAWQARRSPVVCILTGSLWMTTIVEVMSRGPSRGLHPCGSLVTPHMFQQVLAQQVVSLLVVVIVIVSTTERGDLRLNSCSSS